MTDEVLTDERIAHLLGMPKRLMSDPGKWARKPGHEQIGCEYRGENDERFHFFARKNLRLSEDFSCGLRWLSPGGEETILIRFNGRSHSHGNALGEPLLTLEFHVHRALGRYLERGLKSDAYAEQPRFPYATVVQAAHHLARECALDSLPRILIQADLL